MRMIRVKLRSCRGMTLAEVLAALLIMSLMAACVTTGISSSLRVYRESVMLSDAQTLSSTLAIALMDELRYAQEPSVEGDTVKFTSATFGNDVSVGKDSDGHITVGGKKLIGEGAYVGMKAEAEVKYNAETTTGVSIFEVKLKIFSASNASQPVREVEFSVHPLNG